MGLTSALQIGQSALLTSQLGIQVTSNNLANVATPGFTRQGAHLSSIRGATGGGSFIVGRGVQIGGVQREIDQALQTRLWSSMSDESAAQLQYREYSNVESILGELSGVDLSSELTAFFSSWSERANLTESSAVVVEQGQKMSQFVQRLRSNLMEQRLGLESQLGTMVAHANDLLNQIGDVSQAISSSEMGQGTASGLRDQRDQIIGKLSELMDINVVEQNNGTYDVFVGSTPIVLSGQSRGLDIKRQSVNGELEVSVVVGNNGRELQVESGQIGALLSSRESIINDTVDQIDRIATQLIFQVNRAHSTGTNEPGLTRATGALAIRTADRQLAFNDPTNTTFSELPFQAENGGFYVNVKEQGSGVVQSVRIDVDLDGLTNALARGTSDDTTPDDIRAALNAIPGLTASFSANGTLDVQADTGFEFSFSDDSSGALAVLGLNTFFSGQDGTDISVRDNLRQNPSDLMVGRLVDGTFVDNGTAFLTANLQDQTFDALGGRSLKQTWGDNVQAMAIQAGSARTNSDATAIVRGSLEAQRLSVSGVSVDEESINLLNYQRQYQSAARLISVVEQLTQTLMALV